MDTDAGTERGIPTTWQKKTVVRRDSESVHSAPVEQFSQLSWKLAGGKPMSNPRQVFGLCLSSESLHIDDPTYTREIRGINASIKCVQKHEEAPLFFSPLPILDKGTVPIDFKSLHVRHFIEHDKVFSILDPSGPRSSTACSCSIILKELRYESFTPYSNYPEKSRFERRKHIAFERFKVNGNR